MAEGAPPPPRPLRVACVSDFNLANLGALLENDPETPAIAASVAPFGQVPQTLLDPAATVWAEGPDYALVWTRPEGAVRQFERVLRFEPVDREELLAEVDGFMDAVRAAAGRVRAVFVPTWTLPQSVRGLGLADLRDPMGIRGALAKMNDRLCERCADAPGVYALDAARWCAVAGKSAYSAKLWHMAKVPFGNDVFREAVRDIKAAAAALTGRARKLVIVDLDDTLWGGIVGDAGWENLRLGGHDAEGEAFREFQVALLGLANRGIILGIASKNDEATALEAMRRHPEMVLRPESFAGWRINWRDKAQNIAELAAELNLGLDSVVFIDDNPVERARVREALPGVLVPEWPADKVQYARALAELACFDAVGLSSEDRARVGMYRERGEREALRAEVGSVDEWLRTLGTIVRVEPLGAKNLQRSAQLLNKTNQMNLSTRRLTEGDLLAWASGERRRMWTFDVSDRFGASGLTGLISLEWDEDGRTGSGRARIVDFVLSCRVMGRRVEEAMVAIALRYAAGLGVGEVAAEYIETPKNRPCLEFWQRSGLTVKNDGRTFAWDNGRPYPLPESIELQGAES